MNYQPVQKVTDELLREYYQNILNEMEEIVNAPSLLARLCKYYQLYQEPIDEHHCFLIFVYDNQIVFVKEWTIEKFIQYIQFKQKIELYAEMSLPVLTPKVIWGGEDGNR